MANVIELAGVTKTFGKKNAVDNISLTLKKGEIFGFLGPNGAGKTTTIRMIMDFIRPTSGTVKLFGKDNSTGVSDRLKQIGYLSADSVLYPSWTASQHIKFIEQIHNKKTNTLKLAERFNLDLHTKYHRLSLFSSITGVMARAAKPHHI